MKSGRNWAVRGIPATLVFSALLAGCGGGNDSPPTPATPPVTSAVPPGASQSVAGFIAYLQALVVSAADALEPVDTSLVAGPVDDGIEPQVVD